MKLSPNTNPPAPSDLLIRLHNLVSAAVDVTGRPHSDECSWHCHGCGASSRMLRSVPEAQRRANAHAGDCRAAHHLLS